MHTRQRTRREHGKVRVSVEFDSASLDLLPLLPIPARRNCPHDDERLDEYAVTKQQHRSGSIGKNRSTKSTRMTRRRVGSEPTPDDPIERPQPDSIREDRNDGKVYSLLVRPEPISSQMSQQYASISEAV